MSFGCVIGLGRGAAGWEVGCADWTSGRVSTSWGKSIALSSGDRCASLPARDYGESPQSLAGGGGALFSPFSVTIQLVSGPGLAGAADSTLAGGADRRLDRRTPREAGRDALFARSKWKPIVGSKWKLVTSTLIPLQASTLSVQ